MSGPRPLARMVPKIANSAVGKRGMAFGTLLSEWEAVVGPQLALCCFPEKIVFPKGRREGAVLHVRVTGSTALALQHDEPIVLERINGVFGYKAVERLKLIQSPPSLKQPRRVAPPLPDAARAAKVSKLVSNVEDEILRQVLSRLGNAVLAQRKT